MSFTFEATEKYTSTICCSCGIVFCLPEWYEKKRREDHKGFYCPNGHNLAYNDETEAEKLKRQLALVNDRMVIRQQEIDRLNKETERLGRSNISLRGHYKRVKNKAAAGVCPVDGCKRHFDNLQRHIKSKHPAWKAEKTE